MDFTRQPIIESVITPREGYKLVVRSSKNASHPEYFVEAVEVVCFGHALFYRCTERPRAFLVPATDYEILEAREARAVLKHVGADKAIKIGGGREAAVRHVREEEVPHVEEVIPVKEDPLVLAPVVRDSKRRDKRRRAKRRGKDESGLILHPTEEEKVDQEPVAVQPVVPSPFLMAPPPLISETIARYKEQFKEAFYTKEEALGEGEQLPPKEIELPQPAYGSFEMSEEDEEEIYRQRKQRERGDEEEITETASPEA